MKPSFLTEDDRYVVEGKSKLSNVVLRIIVIEALLLGISAEIAVNTLIPSLKKQEGVNAPAQRSVYANIYSTDKVESLVSLSIMKETREESNYFTSLLRGDERSVIGVKFSVRLAMLLAMIVIPLAVFVNRYAQYRIAKPIMQLSMAMSEIYIPKIFQ